ncbi:hypothetical protein CSW00_08390 [Pseudomonas asiatica]|nr:hypothetical protein CSW00_08390 [Pseudomonas sp. MR 02]
MTKKATASIASHLLQQKPGACHAAHSLVGAALCCEWAAKRPPASIRSQGETGNPPDSDTAHH